MIELTLSVSSGLSEKKKINFFHFRDFFSRGRRKENGRTLSRERRSIPQRSEFFFFSSFSRNERARNVQYSEIRPRLVVNRAIRSISSRSARN